MSSTPTSPSVDEDGEAPAAQPDPQLLRALADLDNLRKRYEARLAQEADEERRRVIAMWLPVVDDLERALEHAGDDAVADGVRAVYDEALTVLTELGFMPFTDVGVPFDPARHEALGAIEADAPPGEVVVAVRPGYQHGESVVRPARVLVSRRPAN